MCPQQWRHRDPVWLNLKVIRFSHQQGMCWTHTTHQQQQHWKQLYSYYEYIHATKLCCEGIAYNRINSVHNHSIGRGTLLCITDKSLYSWNLQWIWSNCKNYKPSNDHECWTKIWTVRTTQYVQCKINHKQPGRPHSKRCTTTQLLWAFSLLDVSKESN